MRLLILGGTIFLGRQLVESALRRGHELTLFTRGQHNPDLFPQLERLRGDRNGNLAALQGRRWDAVIDTCGYVPRVVRASAELLSDAVEHYTFISSISVYAGPADGPVDEQTPVGKLEDESVEEITGESYGPLKALCEQAVERALPGRTLTIRPGLIVGPHDPTERFTYWVSRVARGGEVLAPASPELPVQFIDVRDLADWIVELVERRQTGVFNATGPAEPLGMGALLERCRDISGSDASVTWVDERFLLDAGVAPWTELPLWLPSSEELDVMRVNLARPLAAGLRFRPLEQTIRDTLDWDAAHPAEARRPGIGLAPEREAELLRAWHARS